MADRQTPTDTKPGTRAVCFICERPISDGKQPAETWTHEGRTIYICWECAADPPGGEMACMDVVPSEFRHTLEVRIKSLYLRLKSRFLIHTSVATREQSDIIRARYAWTKRRMLGHREEPPK